MDVWWASRREELASVILVALVSNQKQSQNLRLQDEQNNGLKAWINLKSKMVTTVVNDVADKA